MNHNNVFNNIVLKGRYLKQLFRNIKWAYQRITKGYCDRDVWDIQGWFLNTIPYMLKDLKNTTHSYPIGFNDPDEWKKILNKIAFSFEALNVDRFPHYNPYDIEDKKQREDYMHEEIAFGNYLNKLKDDTFKSFCKYFWDFWD